ncbi:MAG: iron complex outermembrane receptor protein, partial [Saprospiraceae bacterium]
LSFLFFTNLASAQIEVVGIVTDDIGESLIGVNITEKGNPSNGTVTDFDGSFKLKTESNTPILTFSYLGFIDQEIGIDKNEPLEIVLQTDAQQLDEVVVTALGIKRQKRELGYSTESFGGEELLQSNGANLVNSLQGKSAGVQVASPNGVDGGTTRIVIRGNNNISGDNQPLIIVDGVPLENEVGLTGISGGRDWGSAINNINPVDIENVNILKGPTASAKYGSRGANGVILITTKRGKQQRGLGVSYSVQHKFIQPYYYRDVQNTFGAGGPVSLSNPTFETDADGNFLYPSNVHRDDGPFGKATTELFGFYSSGVSWGPRMEGQEVVWWDGEVRNFTPQPDNLKQFFSTGHTTTHNLSVSGGNDLGTMRASFTRTDHTAIVPNSEYDQNSFSLGAELKVSKRIKADIAMNYINYSRLNTPSLGDDNDASFGKGILYSWPRSYKGLEEELNFNEDGSRSDYGGKYPFLYTPQNLWWNTYNKNTTLNRNKLIGSFTLTYQITDWLSAIGRVGTDLTFNQFETRNNPIDNLGVLEGRYGNEQSRDIVKNNDFLLTAHKKGIFGSRIDASISFGGNQWSRDRYGLKANSGEWVNPWLFALNNFDDVLNAPTAEEFRFEKKINSLYGFVNLGYDNFLFLELSGRNDWSSTLPIDNNSYFYPSGAISFIPSEAFEIKSKWLSFWKIRGAYAQTATDADPYQVDFTYRTGNFGNSQTAFLPNTIPPIALRPQQANSYEFGTTLGIFDNKINIDFTYYYIKSFDQILDAPLPSSAGATEGIRINSGVLENKGIEAIVNFNVIQKRDFFIETSFNIAHNKNKVVSLGDGAKILELADIWGLNGPAIAVQEGQSYGTITGYDYIYHEGTGKPILNEDGTHYLFTDQRVPIGNAAPDFTGGWTIRLGYKGFSLNTLVDVKWGGDIYAGSYVIGLQTGQSPETLLEREGGGLPYTNPDGVTQNNGVILDGVYADGTLNEEVVHYLFKYIPNKGGWGRFLSKPGIVENTYVKLREVGLSYKFPASFNQKVKIFQDLSISLVGRDLFYIYTSLPDNINPEGTNGAGNAQGLEWAAYPGTRSFGFNINAKF